MTWARPSDAAVAAGSSLTSKAATNTTAAPGHRSSETTRCGTPERTAIQLLTPLLATGVSATRPLVALAMLACTFLVVATVTEHARHPSPLGLIPLTCNEIQHLFAAQAGRPASDHAHRLRWSWWRRRQQARAR